MGNGGEGGQGCSHDSHTPSFTVSQRIKCQTNQSSSKQTSTGTGHDGIYLPRAHINKIKPPKKISYKIDCPHTTCQPTQSSRSLTIVCSLARYPVSRQRLGFLFYCLSICCVFFSLIDVQPTRSAGFFGGKQHSSNLWSF